MIVILNLIGLVIMITISLVVKNHVGFENAVILLLTLILAKIKYY